MRAEDVVGASFFAVLILSIVVTFSGSRASLAPRQRALWRGRGLALMSVAIAGFGFVNFGLIHNSPQPVVEGNLWDIQEQFSRGINSSRFNITNAMGSAVMIRCKYSRPGLVEGERARVRYVAYDGKLLELDMLTGPLWCVASA